MINGLSPSQQRCLFLLFWNFDIFYRHEIQPAGRVRYTMRQTRLRNAKKSECNPIYQINTNLYTIY
jgi:hypothetical protein